MLKCKPHLRFVRHSNVYMAFIIIVTNVIKFREKINDCGQYMIDTRLYCKFNESHIDLYMIDTRLYCKFNERRIDLYYSWCSTCHQNSLAEFGICPSGSVGLHLIYIKLVPRYTMAVAGVPG